MSSPSKSIKWLLAAVGSVGVYHASANALEIKDPEQKSAIIQQLISERLIVPSPQENWYQIDSERLNALLNEAHKGKLRARRVVEMLRAMVDAEVNITNVDLLNARLATQDYTINKLSDQE